MPLAELLPLAHLPVLPELLAALLVGAEPPAEEVSVPLNCRSLSAAMAGR